MRLNDYGWAAGGTEEVHITTPDGVTWTPNALLGVVAGNAQWLNTAGYTIVCQAFVDADGFLVGALAYRLITLNVADPAARCVVVSQQGQNYLFASGNVWARFLGGSGYLDSWGKHDATAAPVAVDTSGKVATAVAGGERFEIWDRAVITPLGAHPDSWQPPDIYYRNGTLWFQRHNLIETYPPRPVLTVWGQSIRFAGGYVMRFQRGRGMMIYPENSPFGIAFHTAGEPLDNDFNPDIVVMPNGTLLAVSSYGPAERPTEVRQYVIDPVRWTINGVARPLIDLSQPVTDPEPEPGPGPGPNPEPPNPEPDPMTARGYLKTVTSYLCVDPAYPEQVQERTAGGAWEEVEVFSLPGGGYTVRFLAANVFFCLTPEAEFQTRQSAGAWETFVIAEQPYDWKHRFVFRTGDDGQVVDVLFFEEKP